ncbi:hypothetical protein D918_06754 [Trichuris suis]|nr:hypothetical protein D918_06754 [Trichuris suis]
MVRRLNGVKVYYKVREGLPLNPLGRTGIAGRGYLPRWGPTHLVKVILVRLLQILCHPPWIPTTHGLNYLFMLSHAERANDFVMRSWRTEK